MKSQEKMFLSVVIPAYNESERLPVTIDKINSYLIGINVKYEIIVVTDGSKDGTPDKVKNNKDYNKSLYIIENEINKGKGYSVKQGMLRGKGDYILFTDADLSTPIEELNKFFSFITDGFDIVIGSRNSPDSKIEIHQPFYREIMGRIFNFFVRILITNKFRDTQCGFKLFKRDIARNLFSDLKINGFAFDVEILYKAEKLGYKVKELGIIWRDSKNTKVSPMVDSFKMLRDIFRIRMGI